MNELIYKTKFPTFWSFIDRYDQDFLLDYKNETDYWKWYIERYGKTKILNLLNEINLIENLNNEELSQFYKEFSSDIHGLNMNTNVEYMNWFSKINNFFTIYLNDKNVT